MGERYLKRAKWPVMPFAVIWRVFARTVSVSRTKKVPSRKSFEWHLQPDVSACLDSKTTRGLACVAESRVRDSSSKRESCAAKASGEAQLRVTVPRHDRFDLPVPVLRSIIRQADMTVEQFLGYS